MSDHVKPIGPHKHVWQTVFTTHAVYMLECQLCCTRRCTGASPTVSGGIVDADRTPRLAPWQEAWINGGELPEGCQ